MEDTQFVDEREQEHEQETITKFLECHRDFYKKVEADFKQVSEDPTLRMKDLYCKYPHLKNGPKLQKRSKKIAVKALVHEILGDPYIQEKYKFSTEEKETIYKYCVKKIKGLYKHAQALKTGYCNLRIINGFSEPNTISICVTKNTLEANDQWLRRLFKELDNRFPHKKIKNKIMIISSIKNDLDGNATHCDSLPNAWKILKTENDIKIIFVCSNQQRIADVLELSEDFLNLRASLQKKLRILHDEAHNTSEGVPPFRAIIENIILQPNVLSYTPITASNKTLIDETNPLWNKTNIEKTALDYTNYDKTKSDDPHYSSCSKSIRHTFEDLKTKPGWRDYGITEIPRHIWLEIYTDFYKTTGKWPENELIQEIRKSAQLLKSSGISSDIIENIDEYIKNLETCSKAQLVDKYKNIDMERRRQLEFCSFMKMDKEIEAVNNGMNMLNINNIMGTDIFKTDEFNIHLISTPRRNIISAFLCEEAIKLYRNAIVLGIFGNEGDKYHLSYDSVKNMEVSRIMQGGQFNEKLAKLLKYLKENKKVDTNRPFIIIGNYFPTGESLTFVSVDYGTIRSNTRLIPTNAEEDYQEGCRSTYMDTKFLEKDSTWKMPEKFLFGHKQYIENALSYELENDSRIDELLKRDAGEGVNSIGEIQITQSVTLPPADGTVATPIKLTINDPEDPDIKELCRLKNIPKKTTDDKAEFMTQLKKCLDNPEKICEMDDKTKKFDFQTQKLSYFRNYKKPAEGEPKKGHWKFDNYERHYKTETPFINSTNDIKTNQCEILACTDKYVLKDEKGIVIELNQKNVWWIGYKY
jgi:aspartokinase